MLPLNEIATQLLDKAKLLQEGCVAENATIVAFNFTEDLGCYLCYFIPFLGSDFSDKYCLFLGLTNITYKDIKPLRIDFKRLIYLVKTL